ncbi:unnamed protein product [Cuscuta epithymum]|uniref:Uncharacterized protein n=1 Tax=Cuscuta epithymum TaxID=186058 RepID=A0AAV0FQX6_9ASTE|nr:unnamed protein product [Cuscuta epithymum]
MPLRIHFGYSGESQTDPGWAWREIYGDKLLYDTSAGLEGVEDGEEVCSAVAEGTRKHALAMVDHDTFKGSFASSSSCELFAGDKGLKSTTSKGKSLRSKESAKGSGSEATYCS